jgi:hypothetical protein
MTHPSKSFFLLVLRMPQDQPEMSPDQMQQSLERGMAWIRRMKDSGHFVAGEPLGDSGKVLRGPRGRQMSDGPFVEAKEIVAGYVLLRARDLAEAIEVAKGCPGLDRHASVEVRPVEAFSEHC